jgi:hypothetical protein
MLAWRDAFVSVPAKDAGSNTLCAVAAGGKDRDNDLLHADLVCADD